MHLSWKKLKYLEDKLTLLQKRKHTLGIPKDTQLAGQMTLTFDAPPNPTRYSVHSSVEFQIFLDKPHSIILTLVSVSVD